MAPAPLSFAQRGIWFLHQLSPGSVEYNMPLALRLRGRLDRDALARELAALYRGAPLDPLPVQYADYVIWQRELQDGDAMRRSLEEWRRRLRGVAALELPADRPRPAVRSGRGAAVRVAVGRELTEGLG